MSKRKRNAWKIYKILSKQLKFQKSSSHRTPPHHTHTHTHTPTALSSYYQQCEYASLTRGGVRGKGVGDLVIQLI